MPDVREASLPALVDTGATFSCIDSAFATVLRLPVVDEDRELSGINGVIKVKVCLAQIYIPGLDHVAYGQFSMVDLVIGDQPYSALLGRSFLASYTMTYNGPMGIVTISND